MTPEEINKINQKDKEKRKTNSVPKISLYCYHCKRTREVEYGEIHCPICKYPLGQFNPIPEQSTQNTNIPKCPTCGSTNIKKISNLSRGAHALAFGIFSNTARSQFECQDCHYKW